MKPLLYTAKGCWNCGIVKTWLDRKGIAYEERDFQGDGKSDFVRFYREHLADIHRGPDGVAFPIYFDGEAVKQGPGVIIAWLRAGRRLDGYVTHAVRSKGWIDGLTVSGGSPSAGDDFLWVLRELKSQGLSLQVDTDGRNSRVLETVVKEGLADDLVFHLRGDIAVYQRLFDGDNTPEDIRTSLRLLTDAPAGRTVLLVAPVPDAGGIWRYLTLGEAERAAALVAETTGNRRFPFAVRLVAPGSRIDVTALPASTGFQYRTAVRGHMVAAELEKPS